MGREVMRVPLDFDFPVGESYADDVRERLLAEHAKVCALDDHDECDLPYWADALPRGDGWQLWQTVSDGPVTPVFAMADELIEYMCQPCDCHYSWCLHPNPDNPRGKGWRRDDAEKFVRVVGRMPTGIVTGGRLLSTSETVAMLAAKGLRP